MIDLLASSNEREREGGGPRCEAVSWRRGAPEQLVLARTSRAELVAEVIDRLEKNFSDPDEHRGILHYASQAHGIDDRVTERYRNALARAVTEVVTSYRRSL